MQARKGTSCRQVALVRPAGPGEAALVKVTNGKDVGFYWVRRVPSAIGGVGLCFTKLSLRNGLLAESDDHYHVRLNGPADSSCECKGFLRHHCECKHLWSGAVIVRRGWAS
jgi:hypothetical protein